MILKSPQKNKRHRYSLWQAMVCFLGMAIVFSAIHPLPASARENHIKRPKIGLVLSGGGARGAAHIGVIQVLEELHIPIDCIVGTSMGSIVGGLYASGMTTTQIQDVVNSIDWAGAMQDNIERKNRSFRRKTDDKNDLVKHKPGLSDDLKIKLPSGLIQGQNIDLILKELVLPVSGIHNFDQLKIPYRAVATDISTGHPVIISSGDLAMALRASMSIPTILSPTEINGTLLVDGGVSNNLPIDVARKMGADIIIAVDISTPLQTREALTSTLSITQQLTAILTRRNTEQQIDTLAPEDLLIVPELGDITSSSFNRSNDAILIGETAARKHEKELLALAVSPKAFTDHLAFQQSSFTGKKSKPPIIEFIRLDNQSRLSDQVFFDRLEIKEGQPLDVPTLNENIRDIYGLELFENISYEIVEENEQTGLVIRVKERSWGPNYLQAGISMSSDLEGDTFYNLSLSYSRTAINKLNGEWRTEVQTGDSPGIFTEIYQPLDYSSKYFFHPQLSWSETTVNLYSRDYNKIAEYKLEEYGADIAVGREFGTWGELRLGMIRMKGDAQVNIGASDLPDYNYDRGELYVQLSTDKLDNLGFPRHGQTGFIKYIRSDENIGADSSFDQILFDVIGAKSSGEHTFLAGIKAYTTPGDDAPIQNRFDLGGLFNLSGYNNQELSGQHLGLLRFGYMQKISDFAFFPTCYLGATTELGNTWEVKDDIALDDMILAGSLFIGWDTLLGPIYIGYGLAEYSHSGLYFYLGQLF